MSIFTRQCLGVSAAVLGLFAGAAQAATQTLDGQYLSVSYNDAASPAGFGQIQLRESALNWDCNSDSCALVGPMSAAVVFGSSSGLPVSVTSQALDFAVSVQTKSVGNIVDPLGHNWGVVSADMGKWTVGVDIASQARPAGDAQFATAYGQLGLQSGFPGLLPDPFFLNNYVSHGDAFQDAVSLGSLSAAKVGVGPGATGLSYVDASGYVFEGPDSQWNWRFSTQLDGARWAYPSTTDVNCASLSCMSYKTGAVNVNNYFLSFDLVATPTAVPELGALPMMLIGLGGMGLLVGRRRS